MSPHSSGLVHSLIASFGENFGLFTPSKVCFAGGSCIQPKTRGYRIDAIKKWTGEI